MNRFIATASHLVALVSTALLYGCLDANGPGDEPTLEGLAQALGGPRPFVARLSAFPHRPCQGASGGSTCTAGNRSPDPQRLARLQRLLYQKRPVDRHLAGVSLLIHGNPRRGLELLESLQGSATPEALNDLAVAQAVVAEREKDPFGLVRALGTVEQALARKPELLPALFNHGLFFAELGLVDDARETWSQAYMLESDPGWRAEIEARLGELDRGGAAARWAAVRRRLEDGGRDGMDLSALARDLPQTLREHTETLLGAWGEAELYGDSVVADRLLDQAETLSRALRDAGGDSLVAAAASAIRSAQGQARRWLAEGHDFYRQALAAREPGISRDLTRRAESALRGSPFAFRARIYLAVLDYFAEDYASAYQRLELVLAEATGYPAVRARAAWLQGLCRGKEGRLFEAITQYRQALAGYRSLGETENQAYIEYLLAEAYQSLGDLETAWTFRRRALASRVDVLAPGRWHNILYDAADALESQGHPLLALRFRDAMVRLWQSVPDNSPTTLVQQAEARLWRARSRLTLGLGDVDEDLVAIEELVRRLGDRGRRLLADVELIRGRREIERNPTAAIAAFTRADALYGSDEWRRLELALYKAAAYRRLGNSAAAKKALDDGISIFESRRARLPSDEPSLRGSYFDRTRPLFEALVTSHLAANDPGAAFDAAERARARVLLDLAGADRPRTLDEVRRDLAPGVTLAAYTVLPSETLLWIVRKDSETLFYRLPVVAADLRRRVDNLVALLESQGQKQINPSELRAELAKLYKILLGPTPLFGRLLVVVPDGPLHRLPFAALVDGERYLIERTAIAIAPSVTLYLHAETRRRILDRGPPKSVLAVGAPAFAEEAHLEPLFGSEDEARTVALAYSDSEKLLGAGATVDALRRELSVHEVLHLSTHAEPNARFPMLSWLALAPSPGSAGFLYAHDLYRLETGGLRLVVLGACRTARGAVGANEGPLSLARPFLARGVPAVVASLWNLDDRRVGEIFTDFHRTYASGRSVAEALRAAQMRFLRKNGVESVQYWGALQLHGASAVEPHETSAVKYRQ